jgi:hypothetical protein
MSKIETEFDEEIILNNKENIMPLNDYGVWEVKFKFPSHENDIESPIIEKEFTQIFITKNIQLIIATWGEIHITKLKKLSSIAVIADDKNDFVKYLYQDAPRPFKIA